MSRDKDVREATLHLEALVRAARRSRAGGLPRSSGGRTWFETQVSVRSLAVLEPELAGPWLLMRSPSTTIFPETVATQRR